MYSENGGHLKAIGVSLVTVGLLLALKAAFNWQGGPPTVEVATLWTSLALVAIGVCSLAYGARLAVRGGSPDEAASTRGAEEAHLLLPDADQIERALGESIGKLHDRDRLILELDVNERCITHRLAMYLAEHFPGWDTDVEYNREGHDPKRLGLDWDDETREDLSLVYPDIIVHRRGSARNLLAVEVKKSTSTESDARDRDKLRAYKEQLEYRFAVHVVITTGTEPQEDAPIARHTFIV